MACNQRVITVEELEEGDMIQFNKTKGTIPHSHWAIYIGKGDIIHFAPNPNVSGNFSFSDFLNESSIVRRDSLRSVAKGFDTYRNNEFDDEYRPNSKEEIVKRAKERLGRRGYNIVTNNCEHFATECRYGQRKSKQVDAFGEKIVHEFAPSLLQAWNERNWTSILTPAANLFNGNISTCLLGDLIQL